MSVYSFILSQVFYSHKNFIKMLKSFPIEFEDYKIQINYAQY